MKKADSIPAKILNLPQALQLIASWRVTGKTVAFTNGSFDILHQGHIASLSHAAMQADYLIVGLNSDSSVKRYKGNDRPINNEQSRALLLASLAIVDLVILFEEDTPINLITAILPDVLVKGGDYNLENIVGAKEVIANGGSVAITPTVEGFSTTNIIAQIQQNK